MRNKILAITFNIAGVLFFFWLPFLFFSEKGNVLFKNTFSNPFYWLCAISFCQLYYFNFYFLIPKFYLRKKYGLYFLIIFLLFVGFYFMKPYDQLFRWYYIEVLHRAKEVGPHDWFVIDIISCFLFVILISLGMVIQVIRKWGATEERASRAESEKASAELSFLKAQINPHFLFNTLNNIYSLSVENHPDTSVSIMKLSNIMRYITDESTKDFVSLKNEITCIRDFIDLQRLRHGPNVKIDFSVSGNIEYNHIAPLILMTYIENVFKYGISSREEAPITIRIFSDDEKISFFCQNKIFTASNVAERTGIGLSNTRQRLKYIYPNKHTLNISSENGLYTVELTLLS